MSKKYLFSKDGSWFKANLHSHSTVSDGVLTPEEAKDVYKSKGYQIYAYSDHHVLVPHPELKDDEFLPITSIECSIKDYRDPDNPRAPDLPSQLLLKGRELLGVSRIPEA